MNWDTFLLWFQRATLFVCCVLIGMMLVGTLD